MSKQRKNTSIKIRTIEKTNLQRMKSASLCTFPQALFGTVFNISQKMVFDKVRRTASMPEKSIYKRYEQKPIPRISQGMPLVPMLPVRQSNQKLFLAASKPRIRICDEVLSRQKILIREFKKSLQQRLFQKSVYDNMLQNRRSTIRKSTLFDHRNLIALQNEYNRLHQEGQDKISQDNSKIVSHISEQSDTPQHNIIAQYIKGWLAFNCYAIKSTNMHKMRAETLLLEEQSIKLIQGVRIKILNYEINRLFDDQIVLAVDVKMGYQRYRISGSLVLKQCRRTDLCCIDRKIRGSVQESIKHFMNSKKYYTVCKYLNHYYIKRGLHVVRQVPLPDIPSQIPQQITIIGQQQQPTYVQPEQHNILTSFCKVHETVYRIQVIRQSKQVYLVVWKNRKVVQKIKWDHTQWELNQIQSYLQTQNYIDRQLYSRFMPLTHHHRRINSTLIKKHIFKIKSRYWLSWLYHDANIATAVVRRMGRRDGYWVRIPTKSHSFSYVYSRNQMFIKLEDVCYEMQYFDELRHSLQPAIVAISGKDTMQCQMRHKFQVTCKKDEKYYLYDSHQLYRVSSEDDYYIVQNIRDQDEVFRIQRSRLVLMGVQFPSKNKHRLWKMLREIIKQDVF